MVLPNVNYCQRCSLNILVEEKPQQVLVGISSNAQLLINHPHHNQSIITFKQRTSYLIIGLVSLFLIFNFLYIFFRIKPGQKRATENFTISLGVYRYATSMEKEQSSSTLFKN